MSARHGAKGEDATAGRAGREPPVVVAILGAESTGKTSLAQALVAALAKSSGHATECAAPPGGSALRSPLRITWVPETLRSWCDAQGRTPRADEQRGIAQAHQLAIESACASHDIVVCDTTAAMTATYSRLLFGDTSLDAWAAQAHRDVTVTLLTGLDLPWVADGLQRDGPHVREPVDVSLRAWLDAYGLPWHRVLGHGEARVHSAFEVLQPALRRAWPGFGVS